MAFYQQGVENFKESNGYVIDDIWYPRVTSIISIKAKPALYRYYADLENFAQGEEIKKKSADEGTRVHSAVEAILTGKDPAVDKDISPAVEAFRKFVDEKKKWLRRGHLKIRKVEKWFVYSPNLFPKKHNAEELFCKELKKPPPINQHK